MQLCKVRKLGDEGSFGEQYALFLGFYVTDLDLES